MGDAKSNEQNLIDVHGIEFEADVDDQFAGFVKFTKPIIHEGFKYHSYNIFYKTIVLVRKVSKADLPYSVVTTLPAAVAKKVKGIDFDVLDDCCNEIMMPDEEKVAAKKNILATLR